MRSVTSSAREALVLTNITTSGSCSIVSSHLYIDVTGKILTQAASFMENWHLNGCTMYVTLEPCPMCAGALVLSRMYRVVYGCDDPKTGACKSLYNIVQDERLNHRLEVTSGVLAEECSKLLQGFFKGRRQENMRQKPNRISPLD